MLTLEEDLLGAIKWTQVVILSSLCTHPVSGLAVISAAFVIVTRPVELFSFLKLKFHFFLQRWICKALVLRYSCVGLKLSSLTYLKVVDSVVDYEFATTFAMFYRSISFRNLLLT